MKIECIVGIAFVILAGFAGADLMATTISTDGSALLSTSGSDANGSFASRVMTVDTARLVRTAPGDEAGEDLMVSGAGPVLFSDFASALLMSSEVWDRCRFLDAVSDQSPGEASVYTAGILQGGEYDASRTIDSGLSGVTRVNGSGLFAFGFQGLDNRSLKSRGFVTGNMSVQDLIRYGGKV